MNVWFFTMNSIAELRKSNSRLLLDYPAFMLKFIIYLIKEIYLYSFTFEPTITLVVLH